MQEENPVKPPREPKPPFTFLVNSMLGVEGLRTATQIRQSHLKNNGVVDPWTDRTLELLQGVEETMDEWISDELQKHPAYPWFSRVKGIGNENIGKVVGPIDIRKARFISSLWKFAGMHVINVEVSPEQQFEEIQTSVDALQAKLDELRNKYAKKPDKEQEDIQVLRSGAVGALVTSLSTRADNITVPMVRGVAPRRSMYTGRKLDYNSGLRAMCFRLAGSLLKAQGKYAEHYDREKSKIIARLQERGVLIVPTLELPKNDGKIFEPVGTIASNHVHMRAMRKMIKLFLSHLWLVWRQAEGLPVTEPYIIGRDGHTHIIDPWDMVEKPEKRKLVRRA